MIKPDAKVKLQGFTLNARTRDALLWVTKRAAAHSIPVILSQGSFSTGTAASAGTHAGGGAVDISTKGMNHAQKRHLVKILRKAGYAAWLRPAIDGLWGEHIHAILIGGPDLSPAARVQVRAYNAGRDGLVSDLPDNEWRPRIPKRWAYKLGRPMPRVV